VPAFGLCEVGALMRQVADEVRSKADERQVKLRLELPSDEIMIEVDRAQLSIALRALCDNALTAVDPGCTITMRAKHCRASDRYQAPNVVIEVSDDGPGVSDEARQHLFDPFYSGRQAGRGLGMGLAKVWRIAQNHGGHIEVHSEVGDGATFAIVLPISR
jgi:signal transduction histidine kinase